MQNESLINKSINESVGAQKFRQKILQRWIQQNKSIDRQQNISQNNSRCSVWRQQIQRLNRLYNLVINKDLNTIRKQFNYDPISDVLTIIKNCPKNLGLKHSTCLTDFIANNFKKQYLREQFDIQKLFQRQQLSTKPRKYTNDQPYLDQSDQQKQIYNQWQAHKSSQSIHCIKGVQTKIQLDDTTLIIPALNQQTNNYKLQYHMNNSIKTPQRLSQFPSLVTKIGEQQYNLLSVWMANIKLLNNNNQQIIINQPIKTHVKIPNGMTIQQAKKFSKYLHSTADNVWNNRNSGLNVLQKEKMFQYYLDTNGSLGRQYFVKQLSKIFGRKQQKYQSLIEDKRKKFIFPQYNVMKLKQNIHSSQNKLLELYLSLSKTTGKPTYFPQLLRKFYYNSFMQNKNQIKFNFKNDTGSKLTFVEPIEIGKQIFYKCAPYQQFQKFFKYLQFQPTKIYKQHWEKCIKMHNDQVNIQVQKQTNYIKQKYQQNTKKQMQQNKQNNQIIQQINKQYKIIQNKQIIIKTQFIDQFTLKRVYITQQQYENTLINYLIHQALNGKTKQKFILQLQSNKMIKQLVGGAQIYNYKQYYKTYPNIFYNKDSQKSLDFQNNPISDWKSIKIFQEYYQNIAHNDAVAQARSDTIRKLIQQYDKNVPKINQNDIDNLFRKKQEQALKKRKKIIQQMRQRLKYYQKMKSEGITNFPSGFQYCIQSLQKVKKFKQKVSGFAQRVISSYKKSKLPSIYRGQVPQPIYDLAYSIQSKLQNIITQQDIYNCEQLMYQCSGIDVFKLYGDINFDIFGIGVTLDSNINKINDKNKQIDEFLNNIIFTSKDTNYMQTNYYKYKQIQNFNIVALQNQLTNIQYRLINTFDIIANKTVTITYGNIDSAYSIRKINTSQANIQIANININNIVTYKPRLPTFDSTEIQKIYINKSRDLNIYKRQKQISDKQLKKYKQFVFQLPPSIQKFNYNAMLELLKLRKGQLEKSLQNKNAQTQKVKIKYMQIHKNRQYLKKNEQKIEKLTNYLTDNIDQDQAKQQQIKQQIVKLQQQNNQMKTIINNIVKEIKQIPPIIQTQVIALKQEIQDINKVILSYQSKKNNIQSLYKSILNTYKQLQNLKINGMSCETLNQAKIIRDKFENMKQQYNNSVLTYKKLCVQPQQDEKQIKQNSQKRNKYLHKYESLQSLVHKLNQISLQFDDKNNDELININNSIQNKINQMNLYKSVFRTNSTLISYTSHQVQNIHNIVNMKNQMQNQITQSYQHINQTIQRNKQLFKDPKYKDVCSNLEGLRKGFIQKMKKEYQLKRDQYFEDVVIKFNQFKTNFDAIKSQYLSFIQSSKRAAETKY